MFEVELMLESPKEHDNNEAVLSQFWIFIGNSKQVVSKNSAFITHCSLHV